MEDRIKFAGTLIRTSKSGKAREISLKGGLVKCWLPISQIRGWNLMTANVCHFTLPRWLVERNNLARYAIDEPSVSVSQLEQLIDEGMAEIFKCERCGGGPTEDLAGHGVTLRLCESCASSAVKSGELVGF